MFSRRVQSIVLPPSATIFRNLILLLRGEFGASSADSTFLPGSVQPCFGALAKHGAFELGECSGHLHRHPASRSGCVDRLGQAAKSGPSLLELLHDREDVTQRA